MCIFSLCNHFLDLVIYPSLCTQIGIAWKEATKVQTEYSVIYVCILVNNCPTRCNCIQFYYIYAKTALHVSDDTVILHQEHMQTVITTSGND